MKKLRLLLTSECNRICEGCCNKDWDLKSLKKCISFKGYDIIMITGGEPGIKPKLLLDTLKRIKKEVPSTPIYLYTAYPKILLNFPITNRLDGVTFTLHTKEDVNLFEMIELTSRRNNYNLFVTYVEYYYKNNKQIGWRSIYRPKSLRLNIFKGLRMPKLHHDWKIKKDIEWIKDCPLPKEEVFMKL